MHLSWGQQEPDQTEHIYIYCIYSVYEYNFKRDQSREDKKSQLPIVVFHGHKLINPKWPCCAVKNNVIGMIAMAEIITIICLCGEYS